MAFMLMGLLNYGYTLLLTRLLDVAAFSSFAAGQGLILWASTVATVSVPLILAQNVARARSPAEQGAAVRFLTLAAAGSGFIAAVIVGVIATRFAGLITALIVAFSTFILFLGTTTTGWLLGQQRMRALSLIYIAENVLKNLAGLLLVIVAGLREAGALAGFGIGGIVMLLWWPRTRRSPGEPWLAALANRDLWRRTLRFAAVQGLVYLFITLDVVMVALLPGDRAIAASYQASAALSRVAVFIASAIAAAFFPSLSRRATGGMIAARALRMYAAAALPLGVVLATTPAALLALVFPAKYAAMATLLKFTVIAGLGAGGVSLVAAFFQAADDFSCVPWLGAGLAAYVAALLAGWRIGGITGLAAGAALGTLATLALLGYHLVRREGHELLARFPLVEPVVAAAVLVLLRPHPVLWLAAATLIGLRACVRFFRPAERAADLMASPPTAKHVVISSFDSPGNPHYGGGGAAVVEMIAGWLAADFDVTVVTAARRSGTMVRGGVRYRQLPVGWAGPRAGQLLFHALLPFLARRMPHDLWIESFTPPFSTSFLPLFSSARVVGFAQSLSGEEMWARYRIPFFLIERFGLRFYRDVVVLNPADCARICRYSPSATVQVIPNCIDLPALDERLLGRGQHVLFLGRIDTQEKGLDLLLAAYTRSGLAMPLLVAGTGTQRERRKLAALLGATSADVRWLGHVTGEQKQQLLEDSAFVVMPSRFESFGLAALEGMGCGKPVLHFDLPSLQWMDGDVRVPPFDVDALAKQMNDLAGDEDTRRQLGRAAHAAAQRYGRDETANRYVTLVRQILDGPDRCAPAMRPNPARLRGLLHPQRWRLLARTDDQPPESREQVTTTDISPAPAAVGQAWPRAQAVGLVAAVAGAVTLLTRLALHGSSFDLFGDEVIYTSLGRSVVNGGFPRFGGGPFFLHGPGFFYVEAGWERLLGGEHGLIGGIYQMRSLNALLAAATAVVLVLLAARAGSLWAGAVAALLFALDPFCIRQNDRVLLETAMMLWVLLGYLVFSSLIDRPQLRGATARAVGAGLLFGFAVLTKDEAVLLTMLPLLAATALRWGPSRALTMLTVGTAVAVYGVYVLVVAANGHIGALWLAKTWGIQRLLGLIQVSGFHSSGGGSLPARIISEGGYFGTTYVILALAVPAAVLVLRRGGQLPRILALLYCAAAVALGYALILGTLEEQELYLLIVPSLLMIPVAATLLRAGRLAPPVPSASAAPAAQIFRGVALTAALALVLGINLATCVQWQQQPDDGFARLLSYMAVHVPPGATVTEAGGPTLAHVLVGQYSVGEWVTPAARARENVRYVVVPWAEITEGYSYLTASQARHLVGDGKVLFSFHGRTYGDLALYQLPLPKDVRADQTATSAPSSPGARLPQPTRP